MRGGHDLSATPSLVDADIADEVRRLHAAVGTVAGNCSAAAVTAAVRPRLPPSRLPPSTGVTDSGADVRASMIWVVRRASAASVADRPLPSCAV